MLRKLHILLLLAVIPAALLGQATPTILLPTEGTTFSDGQQLLLAVDGEPSLQGAWSISSPLGSGILVSPFVQVIQYGFQSPRFIQPWDPSLQFTLSYCDIQRGCATPVTCSIEPSGSSTEPTGIVLQEVSIRRKGNDYYLRVVAPGISNDPLCLRLGLRDITLPITRCEVLNESMLVEGWLGKERDLAAIAINGPHRLVLQDACMQKEFYPPVLPKGKLSLADCAVGFNASGRLVYAEANWLPITGCEVMYYGWYGPEGWTYEYPAYLKYDDPKSPSGYLLPHHRKGGKLKFIMRLYDYCTGEYVGFTFSEHPVESAERNGHASRAVPSIKIVEP